MIRAAGLPEGLRRECVQIAASHPEVDKLILFGSRARGDADERSDIDLAIIAPRATERDWTRLYYEFQELETLLSIQLVRLEGSSPGFREAVLRQGQLLYERD